MTWEEFEPIIDKLVTIKCELKDANYKLELAWDYWADYVDEDTIKVLEDGIKKRHDTLIKQREECYSNIKDLVMGGKIVDKGPVTIYVSEDNIWNGLKDKKYWETFIPREDVDDWREFE